MFPCTQARLEYTSKTIKSVYVLNKNGQTKRFSVVSLMHCGSLFKVFNVVCWRSGTLIGTAGRAEYIVQSTEKTWLYRSLKVIVSNTIYNFLSVIYSDKYDPILYCFRDVPRWSRIATFWYTTCIGCLPPFRVIPSEFFKGMYCAYQVKKVWRYVQRVTDGRTDRDRQNFSSKVTRQLWIATALCHVNTGSHMQCFQQSRCRITRSSSAVGTVSASYEWL